MRDIYIYNSIRRMIVIRIFKFTFFCFVFKFASMDVGDFHFKVTLTKYGEFFCFVKIFVFFFFFSKKEI